MEVPSAEEAQESNLRMVSGEASLRHVRAQSPCVGTIATGKLKTYGWSSKEIPVTQ